MGYCEKKHYKFVSENDNIDMFYHEIHDILINTIEKENTNISILKDILTEEVYTLLHILYETLIFPASYEKSLKKCFIIIRYLLILPPRKYLKTTSSKNMDIPDFLFWICISYSNEGECSEKLKTYISLAKDIFYYKIKKKDKISRINIIFYVIHVILKRQIVNQPIDFESCLNNENTIATENTKEDTKQHGQIDKKLHNTKCEQDKEDITMKKIQYLFFYSYYDEQKGIEMKQQKQRREMMTKLMRSSVKEIEIDSILANHYTKNIIITKL
jgi:hypothetical protein